MLEAIMDKSAEEMKWMLLQLEGKSMGTTQSIFIKSGYDSYAGYKSTIETMKKNTVHSSGNVGTVAA